MRLKLGVKMFPKDSFDGKSTRRVMTKRNVTDWSGFKRAAAVALGVALTVGCWLAICGCGVQQESALPVYQVLNGKWVRPDGGYVIEIKSVAESGDMQAAYFNPNPIHVAKAQASREGANMKVFIELQDVNYPGSTYNLVYVPAEDRLTGTYYQAVDKETFPIFFERMAP